MTVKMEVLLDEARVEIDALQTLWSGRVQPQAGESAQQAVARLGRQAAEHARAARQRLDVVCELLRDY